MLIATQPALVLNETKYTKGIMFNRNIPWLIILDLNLLYSPQNNEKLIKHINISVSNTLSPNMALFRVTGVMNKFRIPADENINAIIPKLNCILWRSLILSLSIIEINIKPISRK
jgi:hypothetical protein